MAFISVPATAQVNLVFSLLGQTVENTLYFHKAGGWDAETLHDLAAAVADWWASDIAPDVVNAQVLTEVLAVALDTDSSPGVTYTPPTAITGAKGAAPAPNNVALCVSFRTANRGRSARGRNYVSGLAKNDITGNTLDSSVVAGWVAGYNNLLTVASGLGSEWVIASRYHNLEPRPTGITFPVTGAVAVDNTVDSQRRRLPGRGV